MLKIRLRRAGGRNHPFYRVVVIDSRKARDSRAVEELGYYNPLEDPHVVNIDRERVAHWTERGAQVSDAVRTLLRHENATHPTRRVATAFEPEVPVTKPKPKGKGEDGAVATATEAPPARKTAKKTAKKAAPKKEAGDGAEAAPAAAEPAAEAAPAAEEPVAKAEEPAPEADAGAGKGDDGAKEKE